MSNGRGEMGTQTGTVVADSTPLRSRISAALRNVTVRFPAAERQHVTVLSQLTLDCAEGEFLVLIGKSGCGKTTVLNLFAGLVEASEGAVEVLGKTAKNARSDIGYMFARDALVPSRTALGNVKLGMEVRRVPRAERNARANELLERVGLGQAGRLYSWQLSQGMRQRVALARTWALAPALVLMDEPFAALDAQTRAAVRNEFVRMWERERNTVVFVTHDLTEALLLADRVIALGSGGKILGELAVEFDRPRSDGDLLYSQDFRNLERSLRHMLDEAP